MKTNNIHIVVLTETHLTSSTTFRTDGYSIFHSTNPTEGQHDYTGVTVITSPKITPTMTSLKPIPGRLLTAIFKTTESPLHIIAAYAPHNKRTEDTKQKFWKQLHKAVSNATPLNFS
jgi:hypothetical protein